MKKLLYVIAIFSLPLTMSACSISLTGPHGPDSGDEIDTTQEPKGPDSGEEADPNEPQGPDSGDEVDLNQEPNSPDSGDEVEVEKEPTSPDSGDEIDMSEDNDDDDDGDAPTSPDSGDEIDTSDPDKEAADEEIDEELSGGKGSCDSIKDSSICVTYSGVYWDNTTMKLHCQGGGVFSNKPCPSDMLGGCKSGVGTAVENIIWNYGRGGDPFTEVIGYTAQACKSVLGSAWISR